MTEEIVWTPTPKQARFLACGDYEALYAGAAGGGNLHAFQRESAEGAFGYSPPPTMCLNKASAASGCLGARRQSAVKAAALLSRHSAELAAPASPRLGSALRAMHKITPHDARVRARTGAEWRAPMDSGRGSHPVQLSVLGIGIRCAGRHGERGQGRGAGERRAARCCLIGHGGVASLATGRDPVTAIRLSTELRRRVDDWAKRQDDKPGRSKAIRRLIERRLGK